MLDEGIEIVEIVLGFMTMTDDELFGNGQTG
jgi:hypothetical protein